MVWLCVRFSADVSRLATRDNLTYFWGYGEASVDSIEGFEVRYATLKFYRTRFFSYFTEDARYRHDCQFDCSI